MKKRWVWLASGVLLLVLAGCGNDVEKVQESQQPAENTALTTENLEQNGDTGVLDFSELSLEQLVAYYLRADGAGSEGSASELYERFLQEPETVLKQLVLLNDTSGRNGQMAGQELCQANASANVFWYDAEETFIEIVKKYQKTCSQEDMGEILSCLQEEYEAALERKYNEGVVL